MPVFLHTASLDCQLLSDARKILQNFFVSLSQMFIQLLFIFHLHIYLHPLYCYSQSSPLIFPFCYLLLLLQCFYTLLCFQFFHLYLIRQKACRYPAINKLFLRFSKLYLYLTSHIHFIFLSQYVFNKLNKKTEILILTPNHPRSLNKYLTYLIETTWLVLKCVYVHQKDRDFTLK